MPKIVVDGLDIEVENGTTVIQACEMLGIEIPRFCYHERLAIAGNCRMCLVEVEKSPKPVASCAHPISDGMVVHTNTPLVRKAREGVMEFLLINHPLDCPICDQGGECDLQDQAIKYGRGVSRYNECKRVVEDKNIGPLITTHMTRCIHCTRCIRFLEDVAGTQELGALGRGEHMKISTCIEKSITSELSGNIIDLCPVGALTSKPYEFKARSWELRNTETIDVMDAVGSNIRVDSRGSEVMRVLPRLNEDINEEWISDKTRFSYDGLKYQRLDTPMIREAGGKFKTVSWLEAYQAIGAAISASSPDKIAAIAGDLIDVETMLLTKELLTKIGSYNFDCRQDGSLLGNQVRALYTFNTTIAGIEDADACLIVGSNPRHEATILNARLRKACIHNGMNIALIGEQVDLTYRYKHLGVNPWILKQIADAEHDYFADLKNAKNPMIIIGSGILARPDYEVFLHYARVIAENTGMVREDWNGLNILQRAASRVGGLDIGFLPGSGALSTKQIMTDANIIMLLGADELDFSTVKEDAFIIYQGHHGDLGAHRANVILPGSAYTEKDATYVNLEGRAQRTRIASYPPNHAKADWEIINELAKFLGHDLQYTSIQDVRKKMCSISTVFDNVGCIVKNEMNMEAVKKVREFQSDVIENPIHNYFMTNSVSRHSKTMLECSKISSGGES